MNQAIVDATDKMDRYLFAAGCALAVALCCLRILAVIDWPWRWITAPVWIWVILTVLREQFIVRPWKKKTG